MIIDLVKSNPRISIIIIAFIATFFLTIVRYFMTDRKKMREIKERQKKLREEMRQFKNNPEKVMEINKKLMEDMPEQLRQSFKPMIITIVPLLILFKWLSSTYSLTAIASTWIWWYIVSSILISIALSKIFGLQ